MIDNYDALTLGRYMRVNAVLDSDREDLDKQVEIIAILADMTADEVLLLPLADYSRMAAQTAFLREPCRPTEITKDWRLGDLVPTMDFRKINTAQYIDFQTFAKNFPASLPELLSVFLVPDGKAYNDGYDVAEVIERVRDITLADALGLSAFFFRAVQRINSGFPHLLGGGHQADEGPEEEGGDSGADNEGAGTFAERWGWLANIDRAAETMRCSWDAVWAMPAVQFLNTLAYRRDKDEWEKEAMERWKRSH